MARRRIRRILLSQRLLSQRHRQLTETAEPTEAGWLNGFDAVSTDAAAEPKSGRIPVEGELIDPDAQADDQVEETKLPDMKVRQRSKVRAGGVLDLTFDDVEFEIEKDADFDRSMLTPEIEAMDGKEVIIRGFCP